MFIGLLPYLKHLERHEANYGYFLLISDLIAGPRHALKKLAPTLSDIKSQHCYSKQYLWTVPTHDAMDADSECICLKMRVEDFNSMGTI